eukprot:TRINITY_DN35534_c0_g1_i1.p1 TRINITY_DN35534_c0_g1~~TRINITY_DN35534_c0_g1_i1.p1  ORF type:complete len:313 (+),score=91.47 TRINITY_DN35534_c0_g1_i1:89-1027(+)
MATLDIRIDRVGTCFNVGESVKGVVVVQSKGVTSHNGLTLKADGSVALQLSPKAVGIFEACYQSTKPLEILALETQLLPEGKFPDGKTEVPFEFELADKPGSVGLFETYHGVFVNVQYHITVDMQRGMFAKNVTVDTTFSVRCPGQASREVKDESLPFTIEPGTLRNVKKSNLQHVPQFRIVGQLDNYMCDISKPLLGHVRVESCSQQLKSIELQLVRVEFCAAADVVAKEATEIQNIQIAEGNVCTGIDIPIFMIFPRWFTCPTLLANNFKVEFEVNLVVLLEDNHQITENFPIKLYRRKDDLDFLSGGEG